MIGLEPKGGWEKRLERNEHILWAGQPDATPRPGDDFGLERGQKILIGTLTGGLAVLLLLTFGPKLADEPFYYLAGLLFFVGLLMAAFVYLLFAKSQIDAWFRRGVFYALTDRRARSATHVFGLVWTTSYRLKPGREVIWNGREPGDVIFHEIRSGQGTYTSTRHRVGFINIADGARVKSLAEGALEAFSITGEQS
jgi:hypothetical protein